MVKIISLEGIIGSGKSWFLENVLKPALIEAGYIVRVIDEPVDQWDDILPLFYEDPKRWGAQFQMYALVDRINNIKLALQRHQDSISTEVRKILSESDAKLSKELSEGNGEIIYISERWLTSDRHFMEVLYKQGNVSDMEMRRYGSWWNQWYSMLPIVPKVAIYLNTDIDLCMERIKMRARNGELQDEDDNGGVSKNYQLMLQHEHNIRYANRTETELVTWIKTDIIEVTEVKEVEEWKADILYKLLPLL